MTRSWYPWQLFVRKWEVLAPLIFTLIVIVALSLWLEISLSRVPQPVFLHYSTDLGVDALGSPHLTLLLPGALLFFALLNTIVGNLVMLSYRAIALVLIWVCVPYSMLALWFGYLILRVNGA